MGRGGDTIRASTVDSPAQFLEQTRQLRTQAPELTNLLATVAAGVAAGRRYEQCHWWVVRDRAGRVVGCACRTAPYRLVVSPMPADAAEALASALGACDPALPGVTGPRPTVEAVLAGLDPPRAHRIHMRQLVKSLQHYRPAPAVPGRPRRVLTGESDLAVEWFEQFQRDALLTPTDPRPGVVERIAAAALTWWEVDDQPVALAGHGPVVDGVGRVGPVYTPAAHRRKGYGAAVTAAVVESLLPDCGSIVLFTDADNATSNGVYERLGFATVGEFVDAVLE